MWSKIWLLLCLQSWICLASPAIHQKMVEDGLLHIGDFKGAEDSKLMSYYFSQDKVNHTQALILCQERYYGRLLTIYTAEEDDYVRLRIQALGLGLEPIQTAGRYNADSLKWEWYTTTTELFYTKWRVDEPIDTTESCISLLGTSSAYGWVARNCNNYHQFICQIQTQ